MPEGAIEFARARLIAITHVVIGIGEWAATIQPLDAEEREACWCWVDDEERREVYLTALRQVFAWLTERSGEVCFIPDCFDFLLGGEATLRADEVPLPGMGDGRTIRVTRAGGDAGRGRA